MEKNITVVCHGCGAKVLGQLKKEAYYVRCSTCKSVSFVRRPGSPAAGEIIEAPAGSRASAAAALLARAEKLTQRRAAR